MAAASFAGAYLARPRPHPFETQPWLVDLRQLENHVRHHYPNLSWAIESQAIDPRSLHQYTEHAIRLARSDEEAERAIRLFIRAFRDRHFTLGRGDPPRSGQVERYFRGRPGRHDSFEYACSFFQFEESVKDFVLPFDKDSGFVRLPGPADFPAGILTVGQRRIGIVRIATFATCDYRDSCRLAWSELRRNLSGPCDTNCEYQLYPMAAARAMGELSERVRQMQLARVDSLVVDLTGNRGGQSWFFNAAQMFVSKALPHPQIRFPRSQERFEELRGISRRLNRDLRLPEMDVNSCRVLEKSLARTEDLMAESRAPCDPGDIWSRLGPEMRCSNLTGTEYWLGGLMPRPPDSIPAKWESEYDLSDLRRYSSESGLYDGPLVVLVDRRTGSAAELAAAQLQDWGGATVAGERTSGSGGGWMFGTNPIVLRQSRLFVYMPDHAVYRRDGSNTVAGVLPDVCVPWSGTDSAALRARKLRRVLQQF